MPCPCRDATRRLDCRRCRILGLHYGLFRRSLLCPGCDRQHDNEQRCREQNSEEPPVHSLPSSRLVTTVTFYMQLGRSRHNVHPPLRHFGAWKERSQ
jgi:hypothetical protein